MVTRTSADQEKRIDAVAVIVALTGAAPKKAAAMVTELNRGELGQVAAFKDRMESLRMELAEVLDGADQRITQDAVGTW